MGRLDDIDLTAKLGTDEYEKRLAAAQERFVELRLTLGGQIGDGVVGPGLLVVIEGADAGGKGGAIRRIVERLDPRHFDVYSYAKPTEREKRHHFLWRFWSRVPGLGGMCVFDRSWYGRLLVERVEKFATIEQWTRAYEPGSGGVLRWLAHTGAGVVAVGERRIDDGYAVMEWSLHPPGPPVNASSASGHGRLRPISSIAFRRSPASWLP